MSEKGLSSQDRMQGHESHTTPAAAPWRNSGKSASQSMLARGTAWARPLGCSMFAAAVLASPASIEVDPTMLNKMGLD